VSKRSILLTLIAIVALVVGWQVAAFAYHPEASLAGSNFEIDTDANLKVDDAAPSIDWASVNEVRKADTTSGGVTSPSAMAARRTPPTHRSALAASRRTRAT
jgi:hypothetical protein